LNKEYETNPGVVDSIGLAIVGRRRAVGLFTDSDVPIFRITGEMVINVSKYMKTKINIVVIGF